MPAISNTVTQLIYVSPAADAYFSVVSTGKQHVNRRRNQRRGRTIKPGREI